MTQTETMIQAKRVYVVGVQEAPWNVNVLQGEKYEQLGVDMKAAGPEGTDPIDTCVLNGEKFTCDGSHRLRWARKLGWPYLYEIFHPEITTEEQARLFNFKRDFERGDIDPFKLAASFKWFVDKGLKQDQIAEKFGVDQTTVSHRLSLLKIDEPVKKELASLSVSHLEVVAKAPVPVQNMILTSVKAYAKNFGQPVKDITVDQLSNQVDRARREYDAAQALQKALQSPEAKEEFKKCPECKKDLTGLADHWSTPAGAKLAVKCDSFHVWSLATGAFPKRTYSSSSGSSGTASVPQHFKSKVITPDYIEAIIGFFDRTWPKLEEVDDIQWSGAPIKKSGASVTLKAKGQTEFSVTVGGKLEKKDAELSISVYENFQAAVSLTLGQGTPVDLKFEQNGTENKTFATYVRTSRQLSSRQALRDLEESAASFLEEYGKMPRGMNPDVLRRAKSVKK